MQCLKELFLETGKLQIWLQDTRISGELRAEAKAEGEAIGIAKGKAEGRAEGETAATRRMTLGRRPLRRVLSVPGGRLPDA